MLIDAMAGRSSLIDTTGLAAMISLKLAVQEEAGISSCFTCQHVFTTCSSSHG